MRPGLQLLGLAVLGLLALLRIGLSGLAPIPRVVGDPKGRRPETPSPAPSARPLSYQAMYGAQTRPPESAFYSPGADPGPFFRCHTSQGPVTIEVKPDWAPVGARRLVALVESEFFTDIAFFRVNQWITQFGADWKQRPGRFAAIRDQQIRDDPNPFAGTPWHRGVVAFCNGAAHTRTSQLLVVLKPNYWADTGMGAEPNAAPVGRVVAGMEALDRLYAGYGDPVGFCQPKECNGPHWDRKRCKEAWCNAPDQGRIMQEENSWLLKEYPELDYINNCSMIDDKDFMS